MIHAKFKALPNTSVERDSSEYKVLDVTVASIDGYRVRRAVASCKNVVVMRCELLSPSVNGVIRATQVRLMIGLQQKNYSDAVRLIKSSVEDVRLGSLISWKSHLQRCGLKHGG